MAPHRPAGKSPASLSLRGGRPLLRRRWAVLVGGAVLASGCRDVAGALGGSTAAARRNGDQLFTALATRFTGVTRTPAYEHARESIAGATLVPSRVWDDSLWSGSSATARWYYVEGDALAPGRFRLDGRTTPPPIPAHLGEMRRVVTLTRESDNVFEWAKTTDLALGTYGPDDLGRTLRALFALPERHPDAVVHADLRATMPHAAAAFGRLFSIDSIASVPAADDGFVSEVVLTIDPSRLRAAYPHYAAYLAKYALPVTSAFVVTDSGGATWLRGTLRDGRLRLRWRSSGGQLLPSTGPARAMPQQLRVDADLWTKFGMFTVGGHHLVTELRLTTPSHERGLTLTARTEPDWDLPLISERLLRTPLRRPFLGAGSAYSIAVRDTLGREFLSTRSHLGVEESAIVRFLSVLSRHAVTDFDAAVSREQEEFLRECFTALRTDLRAVP